MSSATWGLLTAVLALGTAVSARAGTVEVFAEFASQAGPRGVREARLWIDGEDVTDRSSVSGLRISYAPATPLAEGEHAARVEVVDVLGRRFERSWTFGVTPAEPEPEVVLFFSDELTIELDALPRTLLASALRVAGTTQPDAEVEVTRRGETLARVRASVTGRFWVMLSLDPGEQELAFQAQRPLTGEVGREIRLRVERLARAPDVERPLTLAVPPRVAPVSRAGLPEPAAREVGDVRSPQPVLVAPPRGLESPAEAGDPLSSARGPRRPDRPVEGEVVITKPDPGDEVQGAHVTVLGLAPAGWTVVVELDAIAAGDDVANPAGHFTVPSIFVEEGEHELLARATSPDGQDELVSAAVRFSRVPSGFRLAGVELTAPSRTVSTTRVDSVRVEGRAWPGAEIEVAVNGRLVATEIATATGRFALTVPVEGGANHVTVEAVDADTGRVAAAPLLTVRRAATRRRVPTVHPGFAGPAAELRPRLPVGGVPIPVGR